MCHIINDNALLNEKYLMLPMSGLCSYFLVSTFACHYLDLLTTGNLVLTIHRVCIETNHLNTCR